MRKSALALLFCIVAGGAFAAGPTPQPVTVDSQSRTVAAQEVYRGSGRTFRLAFKDGGTATDLTGLGAAPAFMTWSTGITATVIYTSAVTVVSASGGTVDCAFAASQLNYAAGRYIYEAGTVGDPLVYRQGVFTIRASPYGSGAASAVGGTNVNWASVSAFTGTASGPYSAGTGIVFGAASARGVVPINASGATVASLTALSNATRTAYVAWGVSASGSLYTASGAYASGRDLALSNATRTAYIAHVGSASGSLYTASASYASGRDLALSNATRTAYIAHVGSASGSVYAASAAHTNGLISEAAARVLTNGFWSTANGQAFVRSTTNNIVVDRAVTNITASGIAVATRTGRNVAIAVTEADTLWVAWTNNGRIALSTIGIAPYLKVGDNLPDAQPDSSDSLAVGENFCGQGPRSVLVGYAGGALSDSLSVGWTVDAQGCAAGVGSNILVRQYGIAVGRNVDVEAERGFGWGTNISIDASAIGAVQWGASGTNSDANTFKWCVGGINRTLFNANYGHLYHGNTNLDTLLSAKSGASHTHTRSNDVTFAIYPTNTTYTILPLWTSAGRTRTLQRLTVYTTAGTGAVEICEQATNVVVTGAATTNCQFGALGTVEDSLTSFDDATIAGTSRLWIRAKWYGTDTRQINGTLIYTETQ